MEIFFNIIVIYAILIIFSAYSLNNDDADYLILLGSGLNRDKETITLTKRVNRAALYLSRNPGCKVVVSGGITGSNTVSEAQVMKRMLTDRHVHQNRIIIEDQAKDTKQNILYSSRLIDKNKKTVVCSSDYHILRARLLAMKNGFHPKSICAQSSLLELLVHLPLEEIFIIKDLLS